MTADVHTVQRLVRAGRGLAVLALARDDGSVQATVVNAGVLDHPLTGRPAVGFVVRGGARKLTLLRRNPQATITFRDGWQWVSVEGRADLVGPGDTLGGFDPAGLPRLLREIFVAAGGSHDDWHAYDRVMAEEGRTAVLLTPRRIYSNPA